MIKCKRLRSWLIGVTMAPLMAAPTAVVTVANELDNPTIHFQIENPAQLDQQSAEAVYQALIAVMQEGYAQSTDPSARNYSNWKRFNTAPYLSSGHGNRYLNNYGNSVSKDYLALDLDEQMPVGSILVKDTFTATSEGDSLPGALFIMEKMAEGSLPDTGDWRYATIMPDGSIFGDTTGDNPERMTFCHDCHIQAEDTDYLFLLPEGYAAE